MSQICSYPVSKPAFRLDRLTIGFLLAFFFVGLATAFTGFMFVRYVVKHVNAADLPHIPIIGNSLAHMAGVVPVSGEEDPATAAPAPQPWNGKSRVTILVMGLDYRDWETGDVPRTDFMWLFTVDPVGKTAGMMSIPRDTWVAIPGYDYGKINMAYFYGEVDKTPGGGPALAVKTVENFLEVPINYYIQVDFKAFVDLIDKLDGIYIDVPEEIAVDPLGPGNTVVLQPGRQRVFGAVALGYARNRHTAGSDFDRVKRQMQVILAVRERVLQPDYLPVLIAHAPDVYNLIAANIRTDLTLQQAIQLGWLAREIPLEKIQKVTLSQEEMINSYSPQGWSIQIPIMEKVYAIRDQIFTPVDQPEQPASQAGAGGQVDLSTLVQEEKASVAVQNGTQVPGLAGRTTDYLKSLGIETGLPGDADDSYAATLIIDYTGKANTVAYLANLMHVNSTRVASRGDPGAGVDILIIAGDDWAQNNPMP